ncbi:MAG: hypothetical protein ACK4HV_01885, partial [Parachlamydiaceae bacterium]
MRNNDDTSTLIAASLIAGGLIGLGVYYFSDEKNKKWVKKELKNTYDQGEELVEEAKNKLIKISKESSSSGLNVAIGSIAG